MAGKKKVKNSHFPPLLLKSNSVRIIEKKNIDNLKVESLTEVMSSTCDVGSMKA